jgi:hypothetical protein
MEPQQWQLDGVEVRFEPPDVVYVRADKDFTPEAVRQVAEVVTLVAQAGTLAYSLIDVSGRRTNREARREAGKVLRPDWVRKCAIVGASPGMRVALRSIQLALTMFGREIPELHFVPSEAEGRELIAAWKRQPEQRDSSASAGLTAVREDDERNIG